MRLVRTAVYLRAHGVRTGGRAIARGRLPVVHADGRIVLGRGFSTRSAQARVEIGAGVGGELVVGDGVFLNQGANVFAAVSVRIGDHTRLADHATVYDTDFHPVGPGAKREAPVVIGRNVWVGRSAVVLPGVTIGDHAVVAAGAVVTKDVPPRSVVAGNPARVVSTFECPDDWVRP
ncbi:MAG TPA: acyltransferase [Frankiaceae bacterium]|nr:acyltransferase [Frankiaceae bacterium]